MSFNRTKYDKCAYDLQMKRSTGPGDYKLFGSFAENCEPCLSMYGPVGSKADVSLVRKPNDLSFGNMAAVESELSWRNQLVSKCNDNNPIGKHTLIHKSPCTNKLTSEDTRFTHPIDNFRCMSLTSYQVEPYLSINPQCHIQPISDRVGMNSRMYAKDTHKTPEQKYFDNGEALPKEIPTKNEMCN